MMNNTKKIPVILYKTKKPIIYNQGTKYEKECDTFLAVYSYGSFSGAESMCRKLNKDADFRKEWEDRHHIDHEPKTYFASEQEEMY